MSQILALSSSRTGQGGYLETAATFIHELLGNEPRKIGFVPFASVERSYEEYLELTQKALSHLPYEIQLVKERNAEKVLHEVEVIMVGGGNTFKLLHELYRLDLLQPIRDKLSKSCYYIGWSAGANIAGLTICTTNDMPIMEPKSFRALGLLPFQINPHYLNQEWEGFHGETRDQRLKEFVIMNPGIPVLGLPEGTALRLKDNKLRYAGKDPAVLFVADHQLKVVRSEIREGEDISFLMRGSSKQ